MSFALLVVYITVLYIRPMEWPNSPLLGWEFGGFGIMDILTLLVVLALVGKRVEEGGRIIRSATDWLVVGLYGAALLSEMVHRTNWWMLSDAFQKFGKVILIYFLIVNIVDTRAKVKAIVVLMVGLTCFMAMDGVLQVHRGFGIGGHVPMIEAGNVRIQSYGMFEDPNDLALTLVVSFPMLLMWITTGMSASAKVLAAGGLGLCGYALFLTNSRGGMIALAAMSIVYFYKRFGKTVSLVLGAGVVVAIMAFGPSRMQSMGSDPSGSGRRDVWSQGLTMFRQHPPMNAVFGVGWGMFREYSDEGQTAHNSFLLAACEMGLIGLFFYLGSFYVPLRDLTRLTRAVPQEPLEESDAKRLKSDQALARAMIASVAGFAVAAFFLSRTYIQVPYILVGICVVLGRISKVRPVEEGLLPDANEGRSFYDFYKPDFKRVALGTLATVPLIYVVVRVLWRL